MAKDDQNYSGLAQAQQGLANVPLYGTSEDQYQALNDAQEQALSALEQRYAQPNWFKVAAGFAKPQLGGFTASLGSASDALGDWVEQQRTQQLPIAQMRSQLAQTNLMLGQNKAVSDMLAKRKAQNLPITPDFVSEVVARAPDSAIAKSLQSQLNTQQKQQEITASLQQNAMRAILEGKNQGIDIPDSIYEQAGLPPPGKTEQPGGGFVAPAAGPATVPAAAPAAAAPQKGGFDPKGSFGTPTKLLDNLATTEGGTDPLAINKDSKALGQYQFTPDTLVSLRKQGIKFDPLDPQESRAAADYYLQKLYKDNGNDWNKALAAYGGFKTKDPSDYIKKVTSGVDLTQAGPTTSPQPAPAQRSVLPSGSQNYNPLYTQKQVSENAALSDKELNEVANARLKSLESVGNAGNFQQNQAAIDAMINTITKNPATTNKVTRMLANQGGGMLGGLLNAADAGLGLSVAGIAGQLNLPVNQYLIGHLNPQERAIYEALNTQAAKIAQNQQAQNNVNPGTIRNGEINLYNQAKADPQSQGPNTLLYNLQYTKLQNEMLRDMYRRANSIIAGEDEQYVVDKNSRHPVHDIMTSKVMDDIAEKYKARFDKLNEQYSNTLGAKKP